MRVLALGVVLALAGCGQKAPSPLAFAQQQFDAEVVKCPNNTRTAYARCVQALEQKFLKPVFPNPEMLDLMGATRLAVAVRVDSGQMRPEDADLELARLKAQMMADYDRMALARRSVRAQEAAAAPVSCTRIGNTTTCY